MYLTVVSNDHMSMAIAVLGAIGSKIKVIFSNVRIKAKLIAQTAFFILLFLCKTCLAILAIVWDIAPAGVIYNSLPTVLTRLFTPTFFPLLLLMFKFFLALWAEVGVMWPSNVLSYWFYTLLTWLFLPFSSLGSSFLFLLIPFGLHRFFTGFAVIGDMVPCIMVSDCCPTSAAALFLPV